MITKYLGNIQQMHPKLTNKKKDEARSKYKVISKKLKLAEHG